MWYPASHPSHRMSLGASSPSPQTSHAVVSASPIPSPPPRGAEVCSGGSDRGGIGARDRSEEGSEEAGSDESDESYEDPENDPTEDGPVRLSSHYDCSHFCC